MAGMVLWNRETNSPELVEGDQVQAALASGKYSPGSPEVTQGEAGPVTRDASNIGAAQAHGEHATPIAAQQGAQQREAHRFDSLNTSGDKGLAFAEGVVDALSFGLVHDTGNTAEARRALHSGYALAGEVTGMVLGMETGVGPMRGVANVGERVGVRIGERLLGEAVPGSRAAIAIKAAGGATEMAALMGAGSVGHQFTDAVVDDKEFSATAVLHEAGIGAVMGGTFKFLEGTFGRAARRYEIEAQGGLLDPTSEASLGLGQHVDGAISSMHEALATHETRLGVLKALERDGALDATVPEFMAQREIAIAEARGALADLAETSFDDAIGGDKKAWGTWHQRLERAQQKLEAVDGLMQPRQLERMRPTEPGSPIQDPGAPVTGQLGIPMSDVADMDALMENPARAAEYERIHGRPYERQAPLAVEGEENLGGSTSPTSELKTPMAKGTPRDVQATPSLTGKFDVSDSPMEGPSPSRAPRAPEGPWQPSAPAGRFNPNEWTPARVMGEMGEGRTVGLTEEADSLSNQLNQANERQTKHLFPDGHWAPAAQVSENAQAFDSFRQRMSVDTPMGAPAGAARPAMDTPVIRKGFQPSHEWQVVPEGPVVPPGGEYKFDFKGDTQARWPKAGAPEGTPASSSKIPTPARTPMGPRTRAADLAASAKEEGKAAVRRYLDEWYTTSEMVGPKHSPWDQAAQNIRRHVDDLRSTMAGRETAAQALDLGAKLGLPKATTALGSELNSIYTMRQVAQLGADASKGTAIGGQSKSRFLRWVARRAGGKLGAAAAGMAIGHFVGGPVGYYVGAAMAYKYMGFSGRAAGTAGRLMIKTMGAAEKLLGRPAKYTALAVRSAGQAGTNPSANKPIAYSELGVIKDPIARIADLRRVASSPPTIAAMVSRAAGDMNVVSPEFVAQMTAAATTQLAYLASVAPQIQYDRLGRPMPPSAGDMRKFLEAENTIFHLDQTLDAIGRGQVTSAQMDAFRNGHAAVHTKMVAFLLQDPEALQALERAKLRTIEMVSGVPLTPGADPAFILRQQLSYEPEQIPGLTQGMQPAQALKIPGAGRAPSDLPSAKPLPSQTASGRAPGN